MTCTRVDLPLFCFFPELWLLCQQSLYLFDKFELEYAMSKYTLAKLNTRLDKECMSLIFNNANCTTYNGQTVN